MGNPLIGDNARAMRFRTAREGDLQTCLTLLHPGLVIDRPLKDRVVDIWRELLADERCTFSIVEDPSRPYPESIEAFGMSVFVSDAFLTELTAKPSPMLATRLYQAIVSGRSPVLDFAEMQAGNSTTGLNLFIVHFGLRNHDMTVPRTLQALQFGSAAFYFFHSGYRINVLLSEVFGEQQARYMEAGGFRLETDFGNVAFPEGAGDCRNRPFLFALRKDDVAQGAVNQLSFLFQPPTAILGLPHTEQRILSRALQNESDQEIAEATGVSLDAVKKAWGRIYGRVAAAAPYIIGGHSAQPGGHRSLEKRRHLLDYLRGHLEELRPHLPPRRLPAPRRAANAAPSGR
jgi:hypothetical protein